MRKQLLFLAMTILGGFLVMTGCQENKNSREWIEDNFSNQLSRVYQTKNIEDLFKEFPEGFKIYQVYTLCENDQSYHVKVNLIGNSTTKLIEGNIEKVEVETAPYKETIIKSTRIQYSNNQFIFSEPAVAKELWEFKEFLFQELAINKTFLSSLEMKTKRFSELNGSFDIDYQLKNNTLNTYFQKEKDDEATLTLGSSLREDDYYYSVVVDYNDGRYFRETISNDDEE